MIADRALLVPPGKVIHTGYVGVFNVVLDNRERIAVGDIDRAFQRILQQGDACQWPCPNGHWEGDTFHIHDGRHEWVASVMLGKTHILVAWIE